MKHHISLLIVAALAVLTSSCATDSGNLAADRRGRVTNAVLSELGKAVGAVVVSSLKNVATDAISGRKVDMAHALDEGLWTNMGSVLSSDGIGRVMNAWSGDELKPVTAMAVAKVKEIEKATGPLTPVESRSIMGTIASAIAGQIK